MNMFTPTKSMLNGGPWLLPMMKRLVILWVLIVLCAQLWYNNIVKAHWILSLEHALIAITGIATVCQVIMLYSLSKMLKTSSPQTKEKGNRIV